MFKSFQISIYNLYAYFKALPLNILLCIALPLNILHMLHFEYTAIQDQNFPYSKFLGFAISLSACPDNPSVAFSSVRYSIL